MRKNKMMRAASGLLVATLLTTSVISGTFAKYVTQDSATDTARVAKWGVVAAATGDLFGATYKKADDNEIMSYTVNGLVGTVEEGTVSSSINGEDFIVAPGTKNDIGMKLYVIGTPEVSTKVVFDAAENVSGVDYKSSNIYLNANTYGVMVEYTGVITKENVEDYYVISTIDNNYVKADADTYNPDDTTVKYYELHDVAEVKDDATVNWDNVVNGAYYPINWYVVSSTDENSDPDNDLIAGYTYTDVDVMTAALTSSFTKEFNPNMDNALSATVTWSWGYGDDFDDGEVADDDTADYVVGKTDLDANIDVNEDIIAKDKWDTILGNMIAEQINEGSDAATIGNGEYDVVKVDDETTCTAIKYEIVEADLDQIEDNNNCANKVVMAYAGNVEKGNEVACLTVSFNARLTVEQVD